MLLHLKVLEPRFSGLVEMFLLEVYRCKLCQFTSSIKKAAACLQIEEPCSAVLTSLSYSKNDDKAAQSDMFKCLHSDFTSEKPFKCEICSYASIDASSLQQPFQTCTSERPYKCRLCSYSCFACSVLIPSSCPSRLRKCSRL
ncbi:hypothetical protein AV530_016235 [Patagioenas fasciata monilis]|uniref:Uncharacterized protein n=1 Tax=Patagioenas fasciata monilis TaxID=372326 RepID=A0A1V4JWK3_PATFA|nr:hypothetical protein AV530_016235 [Patagioenas fasciata monilis]